jgi:hypothetical protein
VWFKLTNGRKALISNTTKKPKKFPNKSSSVTSVGKIKVAGGAQMVEQREPPEYAKTQNKASCGVLQVSFKDVLFFKGVL